MTDRERFEAWAVSKHFAIHRNGGEQYVNTATHHAWAGWQASRKQALEEAALICDQVQAEEYDSGCNGASQCSSKIWDLATPEGEQG